MIGAIVGLVSLLLALVLGTLVGSSLRRSSRPRNRRLETFAARSVQLDLALAEFGPETAQARARMKATLQGVREMIWGEGAEKDPLDFSIAEPLPHLRELDECASRSEDAGPAAIRGSGGRRRGRDRADPVADLAAIGQFDLLASGDYCHFVGADPFLRVRPSLPHQRHHARRIGPRRFRRRQRIVPDSRAQPALYRNLPGPSGAYDQMLSSLGR